MRSPSMEMLTGAAEDGVSLVDDGHDMAAFEPRCSVVRDELEKLVQAHTQKATKLRMLHPDRPENLCLSDFTLKNTTLVVPEKALSSHNADSIEQRRELVAKNVAWLPSPLKSTARWMDADKWLKHPRLKLGQSGCAPRLVCANVEKLVYTRICNAGYPG